MRFKINLATQRYEDARLFFTRWAAVIAALLILAGLLGYGSLTTWSRYRATTANVDRERNTLQKLDEQQAQDLAILGSPGNRAVRDKSEFLNDLIKRKQISWTKVFMDLETMMPPHIRVLSIAPGLESDQVRLNIALGGDSRDRAAELVRRMEKSNTFRNSLIVTEADNTNAGGGGDGMRFQISTEYVPQLPASTQVAQNASGK